MSAKKSIFGSPAWRAIRFVLLVYAGVVILMGLFQRMYIYYPSTEDPSRLEELADRFGLSAWRSSEGEIIGWRGGVNGSGSRIVVFHGNAGHALHRDYYVDLFSGFEDSGPWEVFLFEYPGYGGRDGRPSEKVFVRAALEAVDEMLEEDGERPLYLVGESLGSGVASHVIASRGDEIDGALFLAPFTGLADVGSAHFPFLPVRLLLRDRYDNARHLSDYEGPVAILVAELDETVPARFGHELYESFEGRKGLWEIEGARHNTLWDHTATEVWEEIVSFLVE